MSGRQGEEQSDCGYGGADSAIQNECNCTNESDHCVPNCFVRAKEGFTYGIENAGDNKTPADHLENIIQPQ